MPARLAWNGYGKAGVRLVKVGRSEDRHELADVTVEVQLQGEFEEVHRAGDNRAVLPTDTMKNTVYALAASHPVDPPEAFALVLGRHFLGACPAAATAVIRIESHRWERLRPGGAPHAHAFARGSAERRIATATIDRGGEMVSAGLEGLALLKTTGSGFEGFLRDDYTTLRETADRIFATEVSAVWRYAPAPADWNAAWAGARQALLDVFAREYSRSVQETLYAMGAAALEACREIRDIRLVLPNQHHLVVDLSPFGLTNRDEIFVATREPYGRIEAVVERTGGQ
ncbi:MAG: factor-independent urate hydroxylase [Gemmatimonadales bacterium]